METSLENLKFGSLYHFPDNNICVIRYDDPMTTKTILKRTPIVPIEFVETTKYNLARIKILATDGTFWHMNMHPSEFKLMKELTSDKNY